MRERTSNSGTSQNQSQLRIAPNELRKIIDEYRPDDDIMRDDDDRVYQIKKALWQLSEPEKIIFCLYLDQRSSRKVGKLLGVSHSTILNEIKIIKAKILELL